MLCVCYLCTQKGCLGHGRLWNEQYWCCVWRVGCVGGGCNFVEGGGREGERQKVEVCVLLVWVGKLLPHLRHFCLIIDYRESIGIGNAYNQCIIAWHHTACQERVPCFGFRACLSKLRTMLIALQLTLLCCEKRRHISGSCAFSMCYGVTAWWWFCFK